MNFTLRRPSLQHMALVKIASSLWCKNDVEDWLLESYRKLPDRWEDVEKLVVQKVSLIPLPVLLKEKLLDMVVSVGIQLQAWIEFDIVDSRCIINFPDKLIWTSYGTINTIKTNEVLMKDQSLHIEQRFMLACNVCLIDDVIHLRKEMSRFGVEIDPTSSIALWSSYFHATNRCRSRIKTLYRYSAVFGQDVALRYIFENENVICKQLMMETTKTLLLSKNSRYHKRLCHHQTSVLFFHLSKMTAEQQAEIFGTFAYKIMQSLLFWPWQSLFLEIAKDKWDFISQKCFYYLLYDIVGKMSYKRNSVIELFTEFWQQAPETYKQYVREQEDVEHLLLHLYAKDDEKNVKLILKDFSISLRKKLIFRENRPKIFVYLVEGARWNSIRYLIQECLSSAEEITAFKKQFQKCQQPSKLSSQWNKFFKLLEDFIDGYNKRKHMEDKNTSSKRHCF